MPIVKMTAAEWNARKPAKANKRRKNKPRQKIVPSGYADGAYFGLYLPLPAKCLRGNAKPPATKGGRIGLSSARKAARKLVCLLLNGKPQPKWVEAEYSLSWIVTNASHQPDQDNAIRGVKSYLDGLQDAGVILNDDNLKLRWFQNVVGVAEGVIIYVYPTSKGV